MDTKNELFAKLTKLVDGELPEQERSRLLRQLDEIPDGWRQCALAFLESQCLDEVLGDIGKDAVVPAEPETKLGIHVDSPSSRTRRPDAVKWLAIAACIAFAFAAGVFSRSTPRGSTRTDNHVAAYDPGQVQGDVIAQQDLHATGDRYEVQGEAPIAAPKRLVDDTSSWDSLANDVVPPEVRSSLRRLGHDVQTKRRLMPMVSGEGQQFVVPYDEVQIVPVAGPVY
ncbi:MAG: hypothetical protein R3E01_34945 [Pirellulaceae bacterium]|nr:hypothetical protein [Planctomycetales bacterium]